VFDVATYWYFVQQELLDKLRSENSTEALDKKIEALKAEAQEVSSQMTVISDSMKQLNLQASARARLNLKRTEKSKRDTQINKLYFIQSLDLCWCTVTEWMNTEMHLKGY
jgi:hypothetical protein